MFNPEDEDLFRKELEGVKPLVQNRVSIRNSAQGPSEAQLARREAAITDLKRDENLLTTEYVEMVDPHDIIEYKRPGVQEGVTANCAWASIQWMRCWICIVKQWSNPEQKCLNLFRNVPVWGCVR